MDFPSPILGVGDPGPYWVLNEESIEPLLIVVDHASNRAPLSQQNLGLTEAQLAEHIAWDIGALAVAKGIAENLSATLISARYSRLIIDCNRYPGDEASILGVSDGVKIPGNKNLSVIDRERRAQEIFRPYHAAINKKLDSLQAIGLKPVFLSLHSMTDRLAGKQRKEDIAVCWTGRDQMGKSALCLLNEVDGITVGDNSPYALEIGVDFTVPEHAIKRDLPYLMIEIRQDHLQSEAGVHYWACIVSDLLRKLSVNGQQNNREKSSNA